MKDEMSNCGLQNNPKTKDCNNLEIFNSVLFNLSGLLTTVTDAWTLIRVLPRSGSADSCRFIQSHTTVYAQPQCSGLLLRM